jgi:N-acetylneuraminic acid mutarotase
MRVSKQVAALVSLALLLVSCGGDDKAPHPATPLATPVAPAPLTTSGRSLDGAAWIALSSLPTPRAEVAGAVLDGHLYVIAGFEASGNSSNVVEVYDPASDRWQRRANLPEGRDHAMAATAGGKIYVFGGSGRNGPSASVFAYDPASDAWARRTDMPLRRTAGGAAVLDNRIVIVGGTGDSPTSTMVYDPVQDRWTLGPAMTAPREHLAVTGDGTHIYVIGGRWDNALKATAESLDSLNGSWKRLPDLPTARGGTAGGMVKGRIYVAGGEASRPDRTFPEVEAYDPAANVWRALPLLPTPRHGLSVLGIGDTLYVVGGGPTAGLSVSNRNEAITPR